MNAVKLWAFAGRLNAHVEHLLNQHRQHLLSKSILNSVLNRLLKKSSYGRLGTRALSYKKRFWRSSIEDL